MFADHGENRSPELIQWQYLEHLSGAEVCIAHTEAGLFVEPAAVYAAFPTRFRLNGMTHIAYQSFDTLTGAQFRGQGLFVRLAEILYQRLAAQGSPLVYGIPNDDSYGGFIRRLNWKSLDPLPIMVRPTGTRYLRVRARLRVPKITGVPCESSNEIREVPSIPVDISDLTTTSNYLRKNGVIRDTEYFNWRLHRPGNSYRIIESRDSGGNLQGVLVFEVLSKHGCSVGYIMELMFNERLPSHGDQLVNAAVSCMKSAGADVVLAWCFSHDHASKTLGKYGFRYLPSFLSPIKLHFGYRGLESSVQLAATDFQLSYLDSDTV
jgi:hypothetical protein